MIKIKTIKKTISENKITFAIFLENLLPCRADMGDSDLKNGKNIFKKTEN